jgi:anthranilate/para-aminobenzoate synthase component II
MAGTMRFHPRSAFSGFSLKMFGCMGPKTPKNPQKEGVVNGVLAKLENHKTIDISVKCGHIDIKFKLCMEIKAITRVFGSEVTHRRIQDGRCRNLEEKGI